MRYIIGKIAWVMQICLHTTAAEVGINNFEFSKKNEEFFQNLVNECSC